MSPSSSDTFKQVMQQVLAFKEHNVCHANALQIALAIKMQSMLDWFSFASSGGRLSLNTWAKPLFFLCLLSRHFPDKSYPATSESLALVPNFASQEWEEEQKVKNEQKMRALQRRQERGKGSDDEGSEGVCR